MPVALARPKLARLRIECGAGTRSRHPLHRHRRERPQGAGRGHSRGTLPLDFHHRTSGGEGLFVQNLAVTGHARRTADFQSTGDEGQRRVCAALRGSGGRLGDSGPVRARGVLRARVARRARRGDLSPGYPCGPQRRPARLRHERRGSARRGAAGVARVAAQGASRERAHPAPGSAGTSKLCGAAARGRAAHGGRVRHLPRISLPRGPVPGGHLVCAHLHRRRRPPAIPSARSRWCSPRP